MNGFDIVLAGGALIYGLVSLIWPAAIVTLQETVQGRHLLLPLWLVRVGGVLVLLGLAVAILMTSVASWR